MRDLLVEFLDGRQRNAWLHYPHMQVYVWKGHHLVFGKVKHTLDVASVEVDESWRRRGLFKRWLAFAEVAAGQRQMPVYVENVLNPALACFLRGRGYAEILNPQPSCFYKGIEDGSHLLSSPATVH